MTYKSWHERQCEQVAYDKSVVKRIATQMGWAPKNADAEKDAVRLDWISRQGSEFESNIIMDAHGADEYAVFGDGGVYGQGVTFRDALDAAILAANKEKK